MDAARTETNDSTRGAFTKCGGNRMTLSARGREENGEGGEKKRGEGLLLTNRIPYRSHRTVSA